MLVWPQRLSGPMASIGKIMSVLTPITAMIGKDFQTGPANMKAMAEK